MKIVFNVIGGLFLAMAFISLALTVKDGIMDGYFRLSTVNQTLSVYFPSGIHSFRASLPSFGVDAYVWTIKQTAFSFFGIIGALILILAWATGRRV